LGRSSAKPTGGSGTGPPRRRFPAFRRKLMKPLWIVALLGMNVLWAAAYSCFKLLAPLMDAGTLATLRFGLSALIIAIGWRWIPGVSPRGWDLVRASVMGVIVFVVAPRLQVAGVQMGSAGDAAILMAFDPVIAAVGAAVFLREAIPGRFWAAFGLGTAGVAVLAEFWKPEFQWGHLAANGLVLASFLAETAYSVIGKPMLRRSHPVKLLATALLFGSAVNFSLNGPAALVVLPTLSPSDWLAMAYLVGICTIVGYALWFYAVRETPVNIVALTVFMQPLAGTIFALLLLGEHPRWSQLGGGLFISVGLLVSLRRPRAPTIVHPPGMSGDVVAGP